MKKFLYLLITLSLIVFGCAKANDPYQEEHKMKVIHSFTTQGDPIQVDTSEDMLFIADDYAGYHIYNLNSGALIKSANSYLFAGVPASLQVKYVNYFAPKKCMILTNRLNSSNWQMEFFNLDDPANPRRLDMASGNTVDLPSVIVKPSADTTIADFVTYRSVRVGNLVKYGLVKLTNTPPQHDVYGIETNYPPQKIDVDDNHLYVSYGQIGVTVYNKTTKAIVSHFDTQGNALDVKCKNNYLYIADEFAGFHVYKLDSSMNATKVYTYDTEGYAENVAVRGNYAAVSSTSGGVYLFDISNPDNPKMIDRLPMSTVGYVNNVHFSQYGNEKILYVVSREKGVLKIQID
jgi:hypothetical protein